MKVPVSKRLLCCAELIEPCDTVADVGTDHGYLGIYLLLQGRCAHVIASDLREKPLATARANAAAFGIAECPAPAAAEAGVPGRGCGMSFVRSDGLQHLARGSFDVLVLAGMGGDLMCRILSEAPWLEGAPCTLILQPQSAANELRRYLGERRFAICRERLVQDGGFLYSVMEVRPGAGRALSPAEQYVSPALREENDPLYGAYLGRVRRALERTVAGIRQSVDPADLARAEYYIAALEELRLLRPTNPDLTKKEPEL